MAYRTIICWVAALVGVGAIWATESAPKPATTFGEKRTVDYVLQPGDLLRVEVFQEDDLTKEVRISQEYTINLPLIGTLNLTGKTLRQTMELVRRLYDKDYLVNPQVNITVKEYSKRTVDVQGQVGRPGTVEFPPEEGLTLYQAITRAGGFTRLADRRRVLLTRKTPEGASETITVNVNDIIEGTTQETWPLQKDDSVFVPERIL
ncbi:MAG TPA: polysaccharide biosynthesis/export family protein [Opitutaceae bacterium]|nr:polysaccharide biosynthesis/export family protein [Opitutaceae bacterium]